MKGCNDQNLSRFLTMAEDRKKQGEFFDFLEECVKIDPENFACIWRTLLGSKFGIILGHHAKVRKSDRTYMENYQLLDMVDRQLNNPAVLSQIIDGVVIYDGATDRCVSGNDADVEATAVVMDGCDYILVYESGFQYIRVKTIWDKNDGRFFITHNTKAIKLKRDGEIETDIENIPEVALNTKGK